MDNFFRLLFIWSMPVIITMAVTVEVRHRIGIYLGDSNFNSGNRGLLRNLHPIYSAALPLLLVLIHHPFMLAFLRPQSTLVNNSPLNWRRYQALGNLLTHVLLALLCTAIFAVAIAMQPEYGMPGLIYYWSKAGIFFNLTLGLLHLLPWPPFMLGTTFARGRLTKISDRNGLVAGAILILAIPADLGYGRLVFPLYHMLNALAGF
jgi:hypothetical protein